MRIDHVALWTHDLEASRQFYERYFGGIAGEKYSSVRRPFASYFITFADGARLELMTLPTLKDTPDKSEHIGWAHVAFTVGSREKVHTLTEQLRQDGYRIMSEPRFTGDGYYESVVLDPDGNEVEIVA